MQAADWHVAAALIIMIITSKEYKRRILNSSSSSSSEYFVQQLSEDVLCSAESSYDDCRCFVRSIINRSQKRRTHIWRDVQSILTVNIRPLISTFQTMSIDHPFSSWQCVVEIYITTFFVCLLWMKNKNILPRDCYRPIGLIVAETFIKSARFYWFHNGMSKEEAVYNYPSGLLIKELCKCHGCCRPYYFRLSSAPIYVIV